MNPWFAVSVMWIAVIGEGISMARIWLGDQAHTEFRLRCMPFLSQQEGARALAVETWIVLGLLSITALRTFTLCFPDPSRGLTGIPTPVLALFFFFFSCLLMGVLIWFLGRPGWAIAPALREKVLSKRTR